MTYDKENLGLKGRSLTKLTRRSLQSSIQVFKKPTVLYMHQKGNEPTAPWQKLLPSEGRTASLPKSTVKAPEKRANTKNHVTEKGNIILALRVFHIQGTKI